MGFALVPVSRVGLSVQPPPAALPLLQPVQPLPFETLTIRPCVFAVAVGFAVQKVSAVRVSVFELFVALAVTQIVSPLSFVYSARKVEEDSFAISLFLANTVHYHFSVISGSLVLYFFQNGDSPVSF